MRVAFVCQPFDYMTYRVQGGSIAIWTDKVIECLEDTEHEFIVYARLFPGQKTHEQYGNIEYHRFGNKPDILLGKGSHLVERLLNYPQPKKPFFSTELAHYFYIYQIARDLQKRNCDVVHVHNFSQFVPILRRYNPKVKIVIHMNCSWLAQLDQQMIEGRLQQVDAIFGCSKFITNEVKQRFPQFADKCHVMYNGADTSHFVLNEHLAAKDPERTKNLLMMGRVSPEKGVHVMLEAMNEIIERYPKVRLNVVGPIGSAPFEYMGLISYDPKVNGIKHFYRRPLYRDGYAEKLSRLLEPLKDKVVLTGPVPYSKVIRYYEEADILVSASLTEAFSLTLVESLACQVPIVATRVGGSTEIVEETGAGILVESDRADELAKAVLHLLENESLRQQMSTAGYGQFLERFTWGNIAKETMRQYKALLSSTGSD